MTHPSSRTPTVCAQQDALRKFARALLVGHGASVDHAGIVVDHLIEAETMGLRSHGMIRVPQYLADIASGEIDPKATPHFLFARPTANARPNPAAAPVTSAFLLPEPTFLS